MSGAAAYTFRRDRDVFFVTTHLDSFPPPRSVFASEGKVMPDPSKVSFDCTVIRSAINVSTVKRQPNVNASRFNISMVSQKSTRELSV